MYMIKNDIPLETPVLIVFLTMADNYIKKS